MFEISMPRGSVLRWVLPVVVLLGVLGMHALMGPPMAAGAPHVTSGTTGSMSMSAASGTSDRASHIGQLRTSADGAACPTCPDTGNGAPPASPHSPAGAHSVLTMCLAVLGSLAALVLLITAALTRHPALAYPPAGWRRVTARFSLGWPPPWTVPSLHQLSLLRV